VLYQARGGDRGAQDGNSSPLLFVLGGAVKLELYSPVLKKLVLIMQDVGGSVSPPSGPGPAAKTEYIAPSWSWCSIASESAAVLDDDMVERQPFHSRSFSARSSLPAGTFHSERSSPESSKSKASRSILPESSENSKLEARIKWMSAL